MQGPSVFALCAGQPRAKEDTSPILVYNPHPFAVETVIDCEVVLPDRIGERLHGSDSLAGREKAPSQVEKESSSFEIDWRKRCVFRARLEPASMNRFDCHFVRHDRKPPVKLKPSGGKIRFQSRRLQAVINCATGLAG